VAGIDVAGADEEDPDGALVRVNPARDSTVLLVAYAEAERVEGPGGQVEEPRLQVAHIYAWRGARSVVDATGVGGGLAAFLQAALPTGQVVPWLYTAASKSQLGYDLLTAINSGRLKLFADCLEPELVDQSDRRRELLDQAGWATRELLAHQVMRWSVAESKGHDDLLNALALVVQAGPLGVRRVAVGRRAGIQG
jgi:hypothetical protein